MCSRNDLLKLQQLAGETSLRPELTDSQIHGLQVEGYVATPGRDAARC